MYSHCSRYCRGFCITPVHKTHSNLLSLHVITQNCLVRTKNWEMVIFLDTNLMIWGYSVAYNQKETKETMSNVLMLCHFTPDFKYKYQLTYRSKDQSQAIPTIR